MKTGLIIFTMLCFFGAFIGFAAAWMVDLKKDFWQIGIVGGGLVFTYFAAAAVGIWLKIWFLG